MTDFGLPPVVPAAMTDDQRRAYALRRLKARYDLRVHAVVYVIVNAMLVAIWAVTAPGGFFWPVLSILGWGIGLAIHAYTVFFPESYTEEQIERELRKVDRAGR